MFFYLFVARRWIIYPIYFYNNSKNFSRKVGLNNIFKKAKQFSLLVYSGTALAHGPDEMIIFPFGYWAKVLYRYHVSHYLPDNIPAELENGRVT